MKISEGGEGITRRLFLRIMGVLAASHLFGHVFTKFTPKSYAQSVPRVVSIHEDGATNWNFVSGFHWEFIDQNIVSEMISAGVRALTLKSDLTSAWNSIIPYATGQSVAIKINFNNNWSCTAGWENDGNGRMNAYPETVNAVIDGLIQIGVPADKIWIADPSRIISDRFISKISNQNVRFYSSGSGCSPNSFATDYVDENSVYASPTSHPPGDVIRPAQVFVDADHIINIPLLKGHGGAGITLGLKNHYGSVTFRGDNPSSDRERMHIYAYEDTNPDLNKSIIADINNNPVFRDKTRLIIGDGLFGNAFTNIGEPLPWEIFQGKSPNILFFGLDPVATDSVMCDYINAERESDGSAKSLNSCLKYAHSLGIGIYDKWENIQTKNYSLIEYLSIEGSEYNPDNCTDPPHVETIHATIPLLLLSE